MVDPIVPKLDAPIVLVHGLFGFDRLEVLGVKLADYFPGIADCIRAAGNRVLIPILSPTKGVAERAAQLKDYLLRESPGQPVHILAHSMGGLDARYMISRLDMADAVLSLTTLGTPHAGSLVADWVVRNLEWLFRPVFHFFGVATRAFYDMTTASCRKFNEEVPNAAKVHYYSVAGRCEGLRSHEWLFPYFIINSFQNFGYVLLLLEFSLFGPFVYRTEGPNDGVVSIASARFGEWQEIWEGDHLSLVNWLHPTGKNRTIFRDPAARYGALLRRIAGKDEE